MREIVPILKFLHMTRDRNMYKTDLKRTYEFLGRNVSTILANSINVKDGKYLSDLNNDITSKIVDNMNKFIDFYNSTPFFKFYIWLDDIGFVNFTDENDIDYENPLHAGILEFSDHYSDIDIFDVDFVVIDILIFTKGYAIRDMASEEQNDE